MVYGGEAVVNASVQTRQEIMSVIQQLNPGAPTYLEKRKPKVLDQRLCFLERLRSLMLSRLCAAQLG